MCARVVKDNEIECSVRFKIRVPPGYVVEVADYENSVFEVRLASAQLERVATAGKRKKPRRGNFEKAEAVLAIWKQLPLRFVARDACTLLQGYTYGQTYEALEKLVKHGYLSARYKQMEGLEPRFGTSTRRVYTKLQANPGLKFKPSVPQET